MNNAHNKKKNYNNQKNPLHKYAYLKIEMKQIISNEYGVERTEPHTSFVCGCIQLLTNMTNLTT